MPPVPSGLLLVTDRRQARRPLAAICRAVLDAGFTGVMVREKDLSGAALLELAAPLAAICRDRGRTCTINDRLDVALSLEDVGAHVGKAGIPVPDARRLLGPGRLLGYSAHHREEAARALGEGADYVTLSPVFASRSKPGLEPRGRAWLEACCSALPPGRVLALGGVTPEVVNRLGGTGVHGAVVMGTLMRAEDPGDLAARMVAAWAGG